MRKAAVSGTMTVFGATLMELMVRRGITQWKQLSEKLLEGGYVYKPSRISNWAYGRNPADKAFGRAMVEVLDLDEEETTKLARAFMLGQQEPVR